MILKILAGALAAFGIAFITGSLAAHAIDTFTKVPASTYAAAGVIPAMLVGQLLITRKRSRR